MNLLIFTTLLSPDDNLAKTLCYIILVSKITPKQFVTQKKVDPSIRPIGSYQCDQIWGNFFRHFGKIYKSLANS